MAHEIDYSKGKAAFIATAPAWHGLGEIFTGQDIKTADALQKAGLDYTVLKLPNVHILPDKTEIISSNSFFTCRTDTNAVLGDKFGKGYEVLQNVETLNVVDEILQSGRAKIETAGAIDGGKKAFICLKVDESIRVGTSDMVEQYVLIANSHDGSMAITALPTNVRVVCNNTLTAALRGAKGAIKIRHTSGAEDRLTEAAKVLKLIADNTQANTDNYNEMQNQIITKEQMFNYFGNVFYTPAEIKALQEGKNARELISTQKQNVLAEVAKFASNGIGQSMALNNGNYNLWYAYNAITGYVTRRGYKDANDRANSMIFGNGAALIETAGVLAAEPQKIQTLKRTSFSGLNLN